MRVQDHRAMKHDSRPTLFDDALFYTKCAVLNYFCASVKLNSCGRLKQTQNLFNKDR